MKISGNPACTCEKKIFWVVFLRPPPDLKKKILEKTLAFKKKKKNCSILKIKILSIYVLTANLRVTRPHKIVT